MSQIILHLNHFYAFSTLSYKLDKDGDVNTNKRENIFESL